MTSRSRSYDNFKGQRQKSFHSSLSVCVSVCLWVCLNACKQNSSWTDAPIWTRFSLNACLLHWLKPYWNWWPWVKGQDHSDAISFFLHNSLLTSFLCFSIILCSIEMKFSMPPRYALNRLKMDYHKNRIGDDIIITSFNFFCQWTLLKPNG